MKKNNLLRIIIVLVLAAPVFGGGIKGKLKVGDKPVINAVVYLELEGGQKINVPSKPAVLDQMNLKFVPHVLPVVKGTKILFPNSDHIRHSVFSIGDSENFDFGTYPPDSVKSAVMNEPGVIPVLCYIHHEMSAYIIVLNTNHFAKTDDSGFYEINNIPAGNYKLKVWHEEYEFETKNINIPENKIFEFNHSPD